MNNLKELFLNELADMSDSEHRITKAFPKFIEAATSPELQDVLRQHLQETEDQKERLQKVFAAFEVTARVKKCPAMVGLLEEGEATVKEYKNTSAINAAVICAAQKVEHYEIASYGCLHAWAELLGNQKAADLLEEILDEEKASDRALNNLAEVGNQEALETAGAHD